MIRDRFALALAAITLSMFLAEAANALPLSTKKGTGGLTGAWSPLDATTSVIEDPKTGLKQFDIGGTSPLFLLDYEATGTFKSSVPSSVPGGYDASGTITVRYSFGTNFSPLTDYFIPDFCATAVWDGESRVLSVSATDTESPIGMVTVVDWKLDSNSAALPPGDTPKNGDTFFLFATNLGSFLEIAVDDGYDPKSFTAAFPQPFEHLGPFTYDPKAKGGDKNFFKLLLLGDDKCDDGEDECPSTSKDDKCDDDEYECRFKAKGWVLDTSRMNADCGSKEDGFSPCGGATFSSINVPEPGTLALFGLGLGLAGLAVRRRWR